MSSRRPVPLVGGRKERKCGIFCIIRNKLRYGFLQININIHPPNRERRITTLLLLFDSDPRNIIKQISREYYFIIALANFQENAGVALHKIVTESH